MVVKLPFQTPENWLKDARQVAAARLKESEVSCEGYYDIELKDKNGEIPFGRASLFWEPTVLDHLWRPVMDALLDGSHTTGWKLHRRGLLVSMHNSDICPWPQEPTSVLAAQYLSLSKKISTGKASCVHVLIPLVDIPPSEHEKNGVASLKVAAGSIILADGRANHKGFARFLKDSHHEGFPILYMTYVQQKCEPEDDLTSMSTGESSDKVKTMEEWMEKKGFLLPASFVRVTQKKGFAAPASAKSQRWLGFLLNQTPKHMAPGMAPKHDAVPSVVPDQTSAFGMAPVRYAVPESRALSRSSCQASESSDSSIARMSNFSLATSSPKQRDMVPDDYLIPGMVPEPDPDLRRGLTLE